jgi:hypothetical protein
MDFQRQDLEGVHYYWTEDQKHLFTGQPSRRIFDRFNGNQVLFLINFYGSLSDVFTLGEVRSIEKRIQDELPLEAKSEITVYNWLRNTVFSEK